MSQSPWDIPKEKLKLYPLKKIYWQTRELEKKQIEVLTGDI